MPDSTISGLPAATALQSNDVLPVVQGGVTKQIPYSLLAGGIASQLAGGGALTLVAVITPASTATTRVTAANIFTGQWENYLIKGENLTAGSLDVLAFQFCVSGAVYTGTDYAELPSDGSVVTKGATSLQVFPSAGAATGSTNSFQIEINNVGSTGVSLSRSVRISSIVQPTEFTQGAQRLSAGVMIPVNTSPVTGFSLFYQGGSNIIKLGCTIEVYGFNKGM